MKLSKKAFSLSSEEIKGVDWQALLISNIWRRREDLIINKEYSNN